MIAILLLIFCGMIAQSVLAFYLVKRAKSQISTAYKQFITPQGNEPPPIIQFTDVIARQFAQHTTASIKGTLMQQNSVISKKEKELETAVTTDLIGQTNPLMGILANFPATQKFLKKNQGMASAIAGMMAQNTGARSNSGNGHIDAPLEVI